MSDKEIYLEKILACDPQSDASRIFALRQDFLAGNLQLDRPVHGENLRHPSIPPELPKVNVSDDTQYDKPRLRLRLEQPENLSRYELEEIIQNLYENFWYFDSTRFSKRATDAKASGKEYPDILNRLDRLLFLNSKRSELMTEPIPVGHFDFFKEMADLLLLPPKQALSRKDWLIEQIKSIQNPKKVLQGMDSIKKNHPDIYRLEFDYFESLYLMLSAESKKDYENTFGEEVIREAKRMGIIIMTGFILLLILMGVIFCLAYFDK